MLQILRPVSNVNGNWQRNDYTYIDDEVLEPNAGDSVPNTATGNIFANKSDGNEIQTYNMGSSSITGFIDKIYLKHYGNLSLYSSLTCRIKIDGVWTSYKSSNLSGYFIDGITTYKWATVEFVGPWNISPSTAFQLEYLTPTSCDLCGLEIDVAYLQFDFPSGDGSIFLSGSASATIARTSIGDGGFNLSASSTIKFTGKTIADGGVNLSDESDIFCTYRYIPTSKFNLSGYSDVSAEASLSCLGDGGFSLGGTYELSPTYSYAVDQQSACYSDDFNRTNQSLSGNTFNGGTWQTFIFDGLSDFQIVSNQARLTTPISGSYQVAMSPNMSVPVGYDGAIEFSFKWGDTNQILLVSARDYGIHSYAVLFQADNSAFALLRYDNTDTNDATALGFSAFGWGSLSTWYTVRMDANRFGFSVSITDGISTSTLDATDSTYYQRSFDTYIALISQSFPTGLGDYFGLEDFQICLYKDPEILLAGQQDNHRQYKQVFHELSQ